MLPFGKKHMLHYSRCVTCVALMIKPIFNNSTGFIIPSAVSFTREKILTHAFEIIRREGISALSARKIAQELECSTRPVYSAYNSRQELHEAVISIAREFALTYFVQRQESTDPVFLTLGLRYYQFSQDEPALFRLLFLEGKIGISLEQLGRPFVSLLGNLAQDANFEGLDEAAGKQIATNMWIYTHGLVAINSCAPIKNAEPIIRENLIQMGRTLFESQKRKTS